MAFFDSTSKPKSTRGTKAPKYSEEFLHKSECSACPLNITTGLKHPHMEPTGSKHPIVYILGEAPGKEEDLKGRQFVGKSGQVLRKRIPSEWLNKIRWNNCVRTRPPGNKTPGYVELECCRPSIVRDIEETKPRAIFGFGGIPLSWATGLTGISFWRGRRMPIRVGNHTCWFFPMYHPSYIMRMFREGARDYGSEEEFAFVLDLNRAFESVPSLPRPIVHSKEDALDGLTLIDGSGGLSDVRKIINHLEKIALEDIAGFDYETNAIRPYGEDKRILTVALSTDKIDLAFPLRHRDSPWSKKNLRILEEAFVEFLAESSCKKVVHNLSFELEWSVVRFGEKTLRNGRWGCSYNQAYILDERYGSGVLSLDGLCQQYFGISMKSLNPVDRAKLDFTPLPKVLPYNCVDARYHRLLFGEQEARLQDEGLLEVYYHTLERTASLCLTQVKGVPVSQKVANELKEKYSKSADQLAEKIANLESVRKFERKKKVEFNPGSNKDVKALMNEFLNAGIPNVDEEHLKGIKGPEPKLILERRKEMKKLSTYVLPSLEGSPVLFDGVFHPIIGTCTTRTWRTSSDSPNAQNWPKHGDGREVRRIVEAPLGYLVVAFDYGGIQARNVAMESKDRKLVEAFHHRYDIHSDWMERIAKHYPKWIDGGVKKLKEKSVRKHYRQQAKNKFVFASFFGAQAYTTSTGLGVPLEIGEILGREFKEEFPDIARWHRRLHKNYRKTGYVTGLSGFRRRAPVSPTEIINTPIQSDESIIVLDALIRLADLEEECFYPNLEIHDDLTFIWPKADVDKNSEVVISTMLDVPFEWAKIVPMSVEMSVGPNWADLEPVGEYFSDEWNGRL